jgi:hypothetical protein
MNTSQCGVLLLAAALTAAAGCEWLDKYNVNFGLRADMSDEAKDPNSVAMLDRSGPARPPLQRPMQEILTTEGLDEALDDDMNDISPASEAAIKEKPRMTDDLLVPQAPK